jgi:hypothetical protein
MDPPEYINTMKIVDLLVAAPKIRHIKAKQILGPYISPTRTVGDLTDPQRFGLIRRIQKLGKEYGQENRINDRGLRLMR